MNITKYIVLVLAGSLIGACSSAPAKKSYRDIFEDHWKETARDVKVLEVKEAEGGVVRGSGIVDQHPVEEFYNPATGQFAKNPPTVGEVVNDNAAKDVYKDQMTSLANEVSKAIPASSRVAVLDFPTGGGKTTKLSNDIAEKIEAALIDNDKNVVDRAKVDKVMSEHHFQQNENALFDSATLAQLGKFLGANVIVYGKYNIIGKTKLAVTAKAVSVETTRVLSSKSKDVPLDGVGADNRQEIMELAETPEQAQ